MAKYNYVSGSDINYIDDLYTKYKSDPSSIDISWQKFFEGFDYSITNALGSVKFTESSVSQLIEAYRRYGHLKSLTNPVRTRRNHNVNLSIDEFGLSDADLSQKFSSGAEIGLEKGSLKDIIEKLNKIYLGPIGFEYVNIRDLDEVNWIKEWVENKWYNQNIDIQKQKSILSKLNEAVVFENFLHTKYIGQKRFSLEGGENTITFLNEIVQSACKKDVREIVIGMAHRGRLNVLTSILQKTYDEIFNEFEGNMDPDLIFGDGDVKYHLGYNSYIKDEDKSIYVKLIPNPSHLESVNPVVMGYTRAQIDEDYEGHFNSAIPILIHGDAAFAGQGVVAECFAMSGLPGHNTGGTIHIIINNQIGFTTSPRFARSSPYPSDIAKMVEAPIIHVNGDDPEAVVYAARIATDFRLKFNRDVVIDLICYRRFGHNEGDEPSFTQPLMYKKIRSHPSPIKVYGEKLINEGSITDDYFRKSIKEFKELLDDQYKNAKNYKPKIEWFEGTWSRYKPSRGKDKRGVTGYDLKKLKIISEKINTIPKEINIHKTIAKVLENRKSNVNNEEKIDWSSAEALAFGSLLEEGYPVRLVGQDSGRGTFSQRHSVLRNQIDNSRYIPLNKISNKQKNFEIVDSFLSELAVLGFEYGYSLVEPNTLTIWEAQFGDFANGAQVVIDQFIASGERKWSRASGLVMLLPHGYEGQGPEHSSARLERFLQLCSNDNMQIMNCTTPANYFHALRRQMHRDFRKPLIIMTPKSLLRHKHCVSNLSDFSKQNTFHRVLWDHAIDPKLKGFIKLKKKEKIKKVILCSGKIYFDLLEAREKLKRDDLVFYRIEQLYPFPVKSLVKELKPYAKNGKFYWCQEEPKNMGAWFSVRDYIQWTLDNIKANNKEISYIGRSPDASPATGYAKRHVSQQQEIIKKVFE